MINQGKVVGGSTAINAMMWVRGNRRNFDRWTALGADGWGYEASSALLQGAGRLRGRSLGVPRRRWPDQRADLPRRGHAVSGIPRRCDRAGLRWSPLGLQRPTPGERRRSAAVPHRQGRPALQRGRGLPGPDPRPPEPDTENRGRGHAVADRGQTGRRGGVSAGRPNAPGSRGPRGDRQRGGLQSPKLLLLSGIGPAEQLRQYGIPIVADLPGVGQNLQDHVQVPFVFRTQTVRPNPQLLTGNILFVNTRTTTPDAPPDMQLLFTPAVPAPLLPGARFRRSGLHLPGHPGAAGERRRGCPAARAIRSIRRSSIRTTCKRRPTCKRSWRRSRSFAASPAPRLLLP